MSKELRSNTNYNYYNHCNWYEYNTTARVREYDRREIHVMDLKPTKNKPSTENGWIEYRRYLKLQRKLRAVGITTAACITTAAVVFSAVIITHHNSTIKILESYDYEYQRACEKEEQLKQTQKDLNDIRNHSISLEIENKALVESLEESANMISSLTMELDTATAYIDDAIVAPSTKKYTPYTDLGVDDIMTVDRMNRIIEYWISRNGATDSPFIGRGESFIKASQQSGLDPIFIFALSAHESDFGRTRIARDKYNYMGIGAYDATPYDSATNLSDNVEGGIIAGANWVADRYYNKGQNTLHQMIYGPKMYSTSTDSWIAGINSIMKVSATIE